MSEEGQKADSEFSSPVLNVKSLVTDNARYEEISMYLTTSWLLDKAAKATELEMKYSGFVFLLVDSSLPSKLPVLILKKRGGKKLLSRQIPK